MSSSLLLITCSIRYSNTVFLTDSIEQKAKIKLYSKRKMQQVHDQAFQTIVSALTKDTIEKFSQLIPSLDLTQSSITTSSILLDPSTTHQTLPPAFMVAIGSNPGSGKTSLVGALHESFEKLIADLDSQKVAATNNNNNKYNINVRISDIHILPMDGYHRYRSELAAMKDPEEAFRRRGAPFTFNDEKYAANMEQLRKTGKLNAPAFAHSKKL